MTSAQVSPDNDELLDLVIDSQERIVAVGWTIHVDFRKSAAVRFLPNGSLDPSFGWGGIRILDGVALRDFRPTRVVLRPDGGLLLSGEALGFLPNPSYELAVISLNQDGSLDESFAGKGWQELDVAPDLEERSTYLLRDAMAIHPSGKIVLLNWKCTCMSMLEAPQWSDTDGDGLSDGVDPDDDNDGVLDVDDAFPFDPTESVDTDDDGIGDNADTDDDGDGMPDTFEIENGFDPLDGSDANGDADGDGFTNLEEFRAGTDPQDAADFPTEKKVPVAIFILLGEEEE